MKQLAVKFLDRLYRLTPTTEIVVLVPNFEINIYDKCCCDLTRNRLCLKFIVIKIILAVP